MHIENRYVKQVVRQERCVSMCHVQSYNVFSSSYTVVQRPQNIFSRVTEETVDSFY